MFSIEPVINHCKNIQKDIDTLSDVLDCAEKLKDSKNPNDRLAKRGLNSLNYDSIKKVAYGQSSVSQLAKNLKNNISKFNDEDMASLEGIKNTAQKLCDIKEIYKAKEIKNTGLAKLRKICASSSFLKDKVKFECSDNITGLPIKVYAFLEAIQETGKKIKICSRSSANDPIKDEILIINKYYVSIKSEKKKFIENFSNIRKDCQELKDGISNKVGELSQKRKNLTEIAKHTPEKVTEQDVQDCEKEIQNLSENFMQTINILENLKIDESTFSYLKKIRTLEKKILADKNNGISISLPDARKRILTLDKRWKLFNKAVIEGNYNNGDKSASEIIEKNLRKIEQINDSLKSNNGSEINIEEIEKEIDNYMNQEIKEQLDVKKLVESTNTKNIKRKLDYIKKFESEEDSIKKLETEGARVEEKYGLNSYHFFILSIVRNIYIEILEFLVKTNEFLEKSLKEIELSLEKFGKKKEETAKLRLKKGINIATKFSSIGCFTGVMISIGCPYLAPVVAAIALFATSLQIAQVALSNSDA